MVEEDLDDQAAEGVAHEDRRLVELSDDVLVTLDDGWNGQRLDRAGIGVERLDLALEAGVGRCQHAVAALGVAVDPVLPTARSHPQSVNQDDGRLAIRC